MKKTCARLSSVVGVGMFAFASTAGAQQTEPTPSPEFNTWGLEIVHREATRPYFSGHGGLTSPNGWNAPIGDPTGFVADLAKSETRLILSHIFRM